VPQQNMCLRIPHELHKQIKKLAKASDVTVSAYYADVLSNFLDVEVDRFPYLFTGPGTSTVTLYISDELVTRLRLTADARDRHVSDLATCALVLHLRQHPFTPASTIV